MVSPMKVIYSCYGGAHSSPVAAAIHLGTLPQDRVPSAEVLLSVHRFDRTTSRDHGLAEFIGLDSKGHEVYVLARGPGSKTVEKAFFSGCCIAAGPGAFNEGDGGVLFVDTLQCVNWSMRVGGLLSRGFGWVFVGRPLVVWGTQRAYNQLVELVRTTKLRLDEIRSRPSSV